MGFQLSIPTIRAESIIQAFVTDLGIFAAKNQAVLL